MLARNYRKVRNRSPEKEVELYNLETDPGETENIADSHPDVVEDLKQFGISNYEAMVPPAMGFHNWALVSLAPTCLQFMYAFSIQVPTSTSKHGSDTGWCRAVTKTECTATNEEGKKIKSLRESEEENNKFDKSTLYASLENYRFVCQSEIE